MTAWPSETTTPLTMGLSFGKIWEKFLGKKEMRILMVGLDAAGKSRARASRFSRVARPLGSPEYLRSRGPCRAPTSR